LIDPNPQYPTNYDGQPWQQVPQYSHYPTTTAAVPYFNQAQNDPRFANAFPSQHVPDQHTLLSPEPVDTSGSPSSEGTDSVSASMYVNHINRSQLQSIWLWTAFISLVF